MSVVMPKLRPSFVAALLEWRQSGPGREVTFTDARNSTPLPGCDVAAVAIDTTIPTNNAERVTRAYGPTEEAAAQAVLRRMKRRMREST